MDTIVVSMIGVNRLGLRNELATYFLCKLTAIDCIVTRTVNRSVRGSVFYEGHYELVSEVSTDFNVDCAMKACKRKLTTAVCHLCSVGKEVSKCSQRRRNGHSWYFDW